MRIACWVTKATDTHSECVVLTDFTRAQWLRLTLLNVCTYNTYLICMALRSRNDYFSKDIKLFFYNQAGVCLLRGTN
jgi:uncharacterized membrane protein SirB2